jgi:hypothetical protein
MKRLDAGQIIKWQFNKFDMLPGTFTMKIYKKELAVKIV